MGPKFFLPSKGKRHGNGNDDSSSPTRDFVDKSTDKSNDTNLDPIKRSDESCNDTTTSAAVVIRDDNAIIKTSSEYKMQIRWFYLISLTYFYLAGIYGCYLVYFKAKWTTFCLAHAMTCITGVGVTAGAHRLWTHRSYKANLPLRILLMLCQTTGNQKSLFEWIRDHRVHHKFTDTDADPYNAKRGFFFSHVGWVCIKKHPLVISKQKAIDMEDIKADPVVMFQKKYYVSLLLICCFIIPTSIFVYLFGETFWIAHHANIFRYTWSVNTTFSVNSFAHLYGTKPYNEKSSAVQNAIVSWFALGEGWHNYHHVFPWDYRASEYGTYLLNTTTLFIDICARIGWAYDMKTVSRDIIRNRVRKTGDNSHEMSTTTNNNHKKHETDPDVNRNYINKEEDREDDQNNENDEMIWGWDDKDIRPQDKHRAVILNGTHTQKRQNY